MNHVNSAARLHGARILPAYASDNYVALLPGEIRQSVIECPTVAAANDLQVELTGGNTRPTTVVVTGR